MTLITDEYMVGLKQLVFANRPVTVKELAEEVEVATSSYQVILICR